MSTEVFYKDRFWKIPDYTEIPMAASIAGQNGQFDQFLMFILGPEQFAELANTLTSVEGEGLVAEMNEVWSRQRQAYELNKRDEMAESDEELEEEDEGTWVELAPPGPAPTPWWAIAGVAVSILLILIGGYTVIDWIVSAVH